jgi:hypothetical protein
MSLNKNLCPRVQVLSVEKCPHCSLAHSFTFRLRYAQQVTSNDLVFGGETSARVVKVPLTCPNTGKTFEGSFTDPDGSEIGKVEEISEDATLPLLRKDMEKWFTSSLTNLYSYAQFMITLSLSVIGGYVSLQSVTKQKPVLLPILGLLATIAVCLGANLQRIRPIDLADLEGYRTLRNDRLQTGARLMALAVLLFLSSLLSILLTLIGVVHA